MTDFAEHLIAARAALRAAEEAILRGDYPSAAHQFETATLQAIRCEQWCDQQTKGKAA